MTPPSRDLLRGREVVSGRYGRFVEGGWAFEIPMADPADGPPSPWANVICDGVLGSVWSQRGGAFLWHRDSVLRRLTRWDQDLIADRARRTVLLVRPDGGVVRSATPSPAGGGAKWRCVHGIGWTRYEGTCAAWRTTMTVYVVPDSDVEIWHVEVADAGGGGGRIRLVSVQDVLLGSWPDSHREFHRLFIECARAGDVLVFTKCIDPRPGRKEPWNEPFEGALAHAATPAPSGFETDRRALVGQYGREEEPARGAMLLGPPRPGATGPWGDACASLDVVLDVPRGGSARVRFATSAGDDAADAAASARDALGETLEADLAEIRAFWERQLGPLAFETPSAEVDLMANVWLRYQAIGARMWGRTGLFQASGAIGYRDQLQDSMIHLATAPERSLAQLRLHAAHQYADGNSFHWWFPETETGSLSHSSDAFLWPVMSAAEYAKESGDLKFLDEVIPFADDPKGATLWEHLRRAIDRSLGKRSPRGVPLMLGHDWNDGLSSVGDEGRGESVWMGHFLFYLLGEAAALADRRGGAADLADAARWRGEAEALRAAVNAHGWDGGWYAGGTTDSGAPFGSAKCTQGKIFLNCQTWAVIAGTATPDRARISMDAMKRILIQEYGALLLHPAYSTPDASIGYLTRYAAGRRENGGVYTHAATWAARAARVHGDRALFHKVLFSLLPPVRGRTPDVYFAEPYVTPGNIDGPGTPTPGKAGWTWYTGSAAWLARIVWEDLLGIRAEHDGLRLAPCVPADWAGFRATRPWRGALLRIEAEPVDGPARLVVDGREIPGDILRPLPPGEHEVRVLYPKA